MSTSSHLVPPPSIPFASPLTIEFSFLLPPPGDSPWNVNFLSPLFLLYRKLNGSNDISISSYPTRHTEVEEEAVEVLAPLKHLPPLNPHAASPVLSWGAERRLGWGFTQPKDKSKYQIILKYHGSWCWIAAIGGWLEGVWWGARSVWHWGWTVHWLPIIQALERKKKEKKFKLPFHPFNWPFKF